MQRAPKRRRRFFSLDDLASATWQFHVAVLLLVLLVVAAISFYVFAESRISGAPWTFIDALYMVVGVITTIGLLPHRLSQTGELITAAWAVVGIAIIYWAARSALKLFVGERVSSLLYERRRLKAVQDLRDHYIVCGYGRMGQETVSQLQRRNIRVAVIEQDPAALEALRATDIPFVQGNATEDEHLKAAGVERARGLIAEVGSDEDNVFIVLSARLLNPALYLVARAGREENVDKLTRAGANRVLSPYVVGGRALAAAAAEPGLADFVEMVLHRADIDLEIALIPIPPNSPAINQPMQGSGVIKEQGAMIVAIMDRTGQFHTNPYPLSTLTEGDRLIAMGSQAQLEEVRRVVGG